MPGRVRVGDAVEPLPGRTGRTLRDREAPVAGALLAAAAFLAGYLVGSLPAAARVAGMAGVDLTDGERRAGAAGVWRLAGPGWGFLALTAELATGVVPVAVGIVTFSWAIGWVAGVGAVLGAGWPAFGRTAGGTGLATFAGVAFTLAPPAGTLSVLLGLAVLGVGRLAGRDARDGRGRGRARLVRRTVRRAAAGRCERPRIARAVSLVLIRFARRDH